MQCEYYDISGNDSDLDDHVDSASEYCEEPVGSIFVHGHAEAGTYSLSGTHGPENIMLSTSIPFDHKNVNKFDSDAQHINKISGINVNHMAQADALGNAMICVVKRDCESVCGLRS